MPQGYTNNRIAISGATGFIGSSLSDFLQNNGYKTIQLTRNDFLKEPEVLAKKLKGCAVIINLAGAPIGAKKWTPSYKQEILASRVNTTHKLVEAIHLLYVKPELLISTSAVGVYDSFEVHDEFSTSYADDFLGSVCQKWEAEAFKAQTLDNVRLCIVRLGVVLGREGGALPRILKPFKYGMGAKLGDGHQIFPFIHIKDVLSAFWYLIQREQSSGIYNFVTPQMISNLELTNALKQRFLGSLVSSVPETILRIFYGEGADLLLKGQKVKPARLQNDGFHFAYPSFSEVLDDLL